jgi:endonuclease-8
MAGLGNLYRNDICFLLGLTPWVPIRDVPDLPGVIDLSRRLLSSNKDRPEQTTTGSLAAGEAHWVFERPGRPCRRCGTRIRTADQGDDHRARITYWCPRCQTGPSPRPGRRATGPRRGAPGRPPPGAARTR